MMVNHKQNLNFCQSRNSFFITFLQLFLDLWDANIHIQSDHSETASPDGIDAGVWTKGRFSLA
jgi:hypothetical protein